MGEDKNKEPLVAQWTGAHASGSLNRRACGFVLSYPPNGRAGARTPPRLDVPVKLDADTTADPPSATAPPEALAEQTENEDESMRCARPAMDGAPAQSAPPAPERLDEAANALWRTVSRAVAQAAPPPRTAEVAEKAHELMFTRPALIAPPPHAAPVVCLLLVRTKREPAAVMDLA